MPHLIVKLWIGKSEQQKKRLAEEVMKAVMTTLNYGEESVSVGIEDIESSDWAEKVYKPDILGKPETIYKQPSYDPLWRPPPFATRRRLACGVAAGLSAPL